MAKNASNTSVSKKTEQQISNNVANQNTNAAQAAADLVPKDGNLAIYEVRLANGDILRAGVSDYKGKKFIALRAWYEADDAWKPGKNGINLPLAEAQKLFDAVNALSAPTTTLNRG